MIKTYRKRPVEVRAVQWTGTNFTSVWKLVRSIENIRTMHDELQVWNEPENQWINCPLNHWVIEGVHGEYYPCDPEIFDKTYEEV